MKKLTQVLCLLLAVAMLAACSGAAPAASGDAPAADSSAAGGDASAAGSEEEEVFFDPSFFEVKALDDSTLEVKLVAQTPYFLELTAFPTYMPVQQATIDANGEGWAIDAASYISDGPYEITEWVTGSYIKMEKNEHYWDVENVGPDTIIFNLIEDDVAKLNAFQSGELQFFDRPPPDEIPNLRSDPAFNVDSQMGTYYVSLNNQVAPFDDPLVREAFSLAINRDHIANVVAAGSFIPAGAWIPPGMNDVAPGSDFRETAGDYIDPSAAAYEANLAKAKELLAEAGYEGGEGLPVIEYIYNDSSLHSAVAESLQDMWSELGATVTIEVQEWATFLNTRKNGEYMAARDGWLNDYSDPIGMLDLFITGSGNNNSQYKNPEFDELIKAIKNTSDPAERVGMMHEAEDTLMNEFVFAPIMYWGNPSMTDSSIQATSWSSSLGYYYFMKVEGYEELSVCVGPDPDTIDPALNSSVDGASTIIHLFEGLYRWNQEGALEPGLAESVDISDDGLTYTFHLRDGLKWSDGTDLTAEDFVYSWTRAINPETAADYAYMFESIAGYGEALGGEGGH